MNRLPGNPNRLAPPAYYVDPDKKRAVATLGPDEGAGQKRRHTLTLRTRVLGDGLLVPGAKATVSWDDDELLIECEIVSDRDDQPPALMDVVD